MVDTSSPMKSVAAFRQPGATEGSVPLADDLPHADGTKFALAVRGISKRFPGVHALDRVDLDVLPGEVHVLLGENGAGKSTLMKILSGVYRRDEGQIFIDGREVELRGPRHAQALGISIIYQSFSQAPHLSVAENLFLGREPLTAWGTIDERKAQAMSREAARARRPRARPADADQEAERRPAPAGRDREGAERRRQDRDHGRADLGADRSRDPPAVRDHRRAEGRRPGDHLHLAPARGGRRDRRPGDGAARRQEGRDRRGCRSSDRQADHHDGRARPRADRSARGRGARPRGPAGARPEPGRRSARHRAAPPRGRDPGACRPGRLRQDGARARDLRRRPDRRRADLGARAARSDPASGGCGRPRDRLRHRRPPAQRPA